MKNTFMASCLTASILISGAAAKDCIMVKELNVKFNNDNAVYSNSKERKKVKEFANFIKQTGIYAVIEGHTNSIDSAKHNYDLSTDRAIKVMLQLKSDGVKSSHVRAMGFGETTPLYNNHTEEGETKNRRVIAEVFNTSEELDKYITAQRKRITPLLNKEQ